jgi:hypothetical protein
MTIYAAVAFLNFICGDVWCESDYSYNFYAEHGRMIITQQEHHPGRGGVHVITCPNWSETGAHACIQELRELVP